MMRFLLIPSEWLGWMTNLNRVISLPGAGIVLLVTPLLGLAANLWGRLRRVFP